MDERTREFARRIAEARETINDADSAISIGALDLALFRLEAAASLIRAAQDISPTFVSRSQAKRFISQVTKRDDR